MSGIVGSSHNIRGSGLVAKLGTDGQVFTSAGAGVKQTFEDAAGGGAWNLLSTTTASDDATVDIETNDLDATYANYVLTYHGMQLVSDDINLYIKLSTGGSYATSGYNYSVIGIRAQSNSVQGEVDTSASFIQFTQYGIGSGSGEATNGRIYIYNPASTSFKTVIHNLSARLDATGSGNAVIDNTVGTNNLTAACDGIQFVASSGNINIGVFKLYGIT